MSESSPTASLPTLMPSLEPSDSPASAAATALAAPDSPPPPVQPSRQGARPSRKNRHLVVPADTLLTFSSYHPPARGDPHGTARPSHNKRVAPRAAARPHEQFVQANYRFAVKHSTSSKHDANDAELTLCRLSPDAFVPWPAVDLVFLPHRPDCPICLHPLRCPRVTPCGHVFDFVCMLQHLAHARTDNRPPRCPLCSHGIQAATLKPCSFWHPHPLSVGLSLNLRLVSRVRGSMICHPHVTPAPADDVPIAGSDAVFYTRFVYSDPAFLKDLLARSLDELRSIAGEDPSLSAFVAAAVENVKQLKNDAKSRRAAFRYYSRQRGDPNAHADARPTGGTSEAPESLPSVDVGSTLASGTFENQTTSPAQLANKAQTPLVNDNSNVASTARSSNSQANRKERWYFYQGQDSSNVFLHPINHRCMSTEFNGQFDDAMSCLEGTVLQIDHYTMDEQLRKRYRFIEHLLDGCEFSFVELNLNHVLSKKTLATHAAELKERHVIRKKKETATKKENKKIERERSELLQDYLNTQTGRVMAESRRSVDSRDTVSFPALKENGAATGDWQGESDASETVVTGNGSPSNRWGAEVSSYSSVTSNMGLFPALGSSPQSSNALQGAWGSSSQNCVSDNANNPGSSKKETGPPDEPRKGRKFHGKGKVLLSNAGSPYRR